MFTSRSTPHTGGIPRATQARLAPPAGSFRCEAAAEFPAADVSVPRARAWLRRHLDHWGVDAAAVETAELVVSELAANAVLHTRTRILRCRLRVAGRVLHLEVGDHGGAVAGRTACEAGPDAERGRGLMLVDAVSEEWGVAPAEDGAGKAVWARLSCG